MNEREKVAELLPCPFCGGEASHSTRQDESLWSHNIVDWHYIKCDECDFEFWECEGYEDIVKKWNTRTVSEREKSMREVLGWACNVIKYDTECNLSKYGCKYCPIKQALEDE